jgi:hypothetical protein
MRLDLVRIYNCKAYCVGKLYIDGAYVCDTLEDYDRGLDQSMTEKEIARNKVKHMTAIPTGTYRVILNVQSPKFSQYAFYKNLCNGYLPRLDGVKGFDGILMHCGSTADNSSGCILIGLNTIKGKLTDSQKTFTNLMKKHLTPARMLGEKVTITITRKYKI